MVASSPPASMRGAGAGAGSAAGGGAAGRGGSGPRPFQGLRLRRRPPPGPALRRPSRRPSPPPGRRAAGSSGATAAETPGPGPRVEPHQHGSRLDPVPDGYLDGGDHAFDRRREVHARLVALEDDHRIVESDPVPRRNEDLDDLDVRRLPEVRYDDPGLVHGSSLFSSWGRVWNGSGGRGGPPRLHSSRRSD